MKYIISLLTILAIIISCNTANNKSNLLSKPGDIKADEYTINIDHDTTLETKNGALLKIPKGSLTTDKGNTVTLEIKEAYSISQMIQAGLTTQANGDPLSSGGMIYINAKAGQNVTITQAIKVAIPTDYLSNNMQLFKGEKDADGNINWKDPAALPENKQLNSVDQGKVLFQAKCFSCHRIGKDLIGPDLAHFLKRFPITGERSNEESEASATDWRYFEHGLHYGESDRAIRNSDKDYSLKEYYHPDAYLVYKCNLLTMFPGRGPILFTDSGKGYDLLNIYHYIQNESDRRNLPLPGHAYLKDCADSCANYRKTVLDLNNKKETAKSKRNNLIKDNDPLTHEKHTDGNKLPGDKNYIIAPPPPADYDKQVSPENTSAVYYQFSIESFGWYNIDVLMKDVDGNQKSELRVRLVGAYREQLDIFLIIPSMNAFVKGGPTGNAEGEYAFGYKDGTIYIPQNVTAYVMAVKETSSAIAFSIKEFVTTTKQELEMELQESTTGVFNKTVSTISTGSIKIGVKESKNANEIRKTDTLIKNIDTELKKAEGLKPKQCDCDCYFQKPDTVKSVYKEDIMSAQK